MAALNKSLLEMRNGTRKFANVQGTTALGRHPDADCNDYINRALGSLHRKLTAALPDQRVLASTTLSTVSGQTTYTLPAGFDSLISLEMTADGRRRWLDAYEMVERPYLISPDQPTTGIPLVYRIRGDNIEFLPAPNDTYSILVWYVPAASQLAADATNYDTINRLDDYVIAYAARFIAIKDKNWDLASQCTALINEMTPEIEALGRNRDRNSPARVLDVYSRDRWGRRGYR